VNELCVGATLVAGGIVGGLVGGLLSAYWWDFPPEDVETYGDYIVPFYAGLGGIIGLIASGVLVAVVGAIFFGRCPRGPLDEDA
jgi:hypothetical protein